MGEIQKRNLLTIGEASAKIGVSPQFLRRLDWERIVVPERKASGHRLYSHEDIAVVKEILDLKNAGITQIAAWQGLLHKKEEMSKHGFIWLDKIRKKSSSPVDLTFSTLETLAIVAYREPITLAEIERIRGVDTKYPLQKIIDEGLIRVCGTAFSTGNPFVFGITKKFLNHFEIRELDKVDPEQTIKIIPTPIIKTGRYRLKKAWIKGRKANKKITILA